MLNWFQLFITLFKLIFLVDEKLEKKIKNITHFYLKRFYSFVESYESPLFSMVDIDYMVY